MITLSFYQEGDFDRSIVPVEWRNDITVTRVSNRYKVQLSVEVEDSSYRYRALMQRPQLVLKFNLPYFVEFPVGTYCTYQGQTYTLNNPQNLKKQGTRKIEYTLTLGTWEDHLSQYKLRNSVDGRLKFSMCARPYEFIREICITLNNRDGSEKWFYNRDHILDVPEKTVEFNHAYCDAALSSIAEAFETEYEIIERSGRFEITLGKVEYFKDTPLPLSYGRGNGFVPGVGRTTEKDGQPIKRLYIQGGDRNIDRSKYGDAFGYSNNPGELRLPKSQTLEYEGRTYATDEQGYYIERTDKPSSATKEDSLDCNDIYPSYIGTVTSVENPKPEKNWWDIIDLNIPYELNFKKYIIAGENLTILFQTGMLAGREFEAKYYHDENRFELVPMEQDGITFPNETFKPNADPAHPDKYVVFGIMLPNEYICNNTSQTGAAWDMFREGARYLYEHEDQKFTFTGELQGIYAKKNWERIGAYMRIGAYIHFTDSQFALNGIDIRIIGVKDYINSPYAPTLEISNSIQSPSTASSQLEQIGNEEVKLEDTAKSIISYTKRRFRDAEETMTMLNNALLNNFNEAISPITVQTMAMLVGDKSLQFQMGRTYNSIGEDDWAITYDNNILTIPSGFLRHLTLDIKSISSGHTDGEYKTWRMPLARITPKETEKYYLYAIVNRWSFWFDSSINGYVNRYAGQWLLDTNPHAIDEDPDSYYLLVGILNSDFEGERSFVTLYGFTEILPGQITTDLIRSGSGTSYFDLARGRFALGNKMEFNLDGNNTLRLRGALVQSPSGNETPLPCYRGLYQSSTRYYRGDVVYYSANGITSSYICITTEEEGILGVAPTNTAYWSLYARGSQGNPGTPGKNAPIAVFRGNYDGREIYYGNESRVDVVKAGNVFYMAKRNAPDGTAGFVGKDPSDTDSDYWQNFGANFESVATSLLLAENATIGNWFISGDNIVSTHGTVNGVESNDFSDPSFKPDVVLDGSTGELVLYSGKYPRVRLSNASVNELFNSSLLNQAPINKWVTQTIIVYVPYSNSIYKKMIGTLCTINLGQLNEDSQIKINDFVVQYIVPGNRLDYNNEVSVISYINGSDMYIKIIKDGRVVQTISGMSASNANKGDTIDQRHGNPVSYTVPTGGAGNYSLEFSLKEVGFTCSHSGELNPLNLRTYITGSYIHGGFNRTVIGNDGIGSFWDDSVFVFSKAGFIIRFGNIGFKVSTDGVEKSSNMNVEVPTWNKI